jgi:hypothetical protein
MATTVISYPTPPYSNPPIEPQFYMPSRFVITAIAMGTTTIVTTSVNHNYVIGQNVKLLIPQLYGAAPLTGQQGIVISIPSPTQVEIIINSTNYNAFIPTPIPTPVDLDVPQIIAIGDINSGITNNQGRTHTGKHIPGSFINISPY